jgi:hypothetical protein
LQACQLLLRSEVDLVRHRERLSRVNEGVLVVADQRNCPAQMLRDNRQRVRDRHQVRRECAMIYQLPGYDLMRCDGGCVCRTPRASSLRATSSSSACRVSAPTTRSSTHSCASCPKITLDEAFVVPIAETFSVGPGLPVARSSVRNVTSDKLGVARCQVTVRLILDQISCSYVDQVASDP